MISLRMVEENWISSSQKQNGGRTRTPERAQESPEKRRTQKSFKKVNSSLAINPRGVGSKGTEDEEPRKLVDGRCDAIGETQFCCTEALKVTGKIRNVGVWVPRSLPERDLDRRFNASVTGALHLYYQLLHPGDTVKRATSWWSVSVKNNQGTHPPSESDGRHDFKPRMGSSTTYHSSMGFPPVQVTAAYCTLSARRLQKVQDALDETAQMYSFPQNPNPSSATVFILCLVNDRNS